MFIIGIYLQITTADIKSISIKGLGETRSMTLSSPNWPEEYPPNTDVYYCITASVGRRVNIDFRWLDLETNCGYGCDYMSVSFHFSNTHSI
jgi:hypothetical protein